MNYNEAKKEVQSKKSNAGYLLIALGYSLRMVLPYAQGLEMMKALGSAEKTAEAYGDVTGIEHIPQGTLQITPMSEQEYENVKIAGLLGISIADLEKAKNGELTKESS